MKIDDLITKINR